MALDTQQKRASSWVTLRSYVLASPEPDGAVGTGDRPHIAWMYGSTTDFPPAGGSTPWSGIQAYGRGFGRRIGGFHGFFFGRR